MTTEWSSSLSSSILPTSSVAGRCLTIKSIHADDVRESFAFTKWPKSDNSLAQTTMYGGKFASSSEVWVLQIEIGSTTVTTTTTTTLTKPTHNGRRLVYLRPAWRWFHTLYVLCVMTHSLTHWPTCYVQKGMRLYLFSHEPLSLSLSGIVWLCDLEKHNFLYIILSLSFYSHQIARVVQITQNTFDVTITR